MKAHNRYSAARVSGAIAFLVGVVLSGVTVQAVLPAGTSVQQWNKIAEDTVVGSGAFQNEGLIYMAYVSSAVYDAVVAIEGGYEAYASEIGAPPGASLDAAVVEAAYWTLRHYFSVQAATLDALHSEALALIPDGPAKIDGRAVGHSAAVAIIALRSGDGRLTPIGASSTFDTEPPAPGVWRLTPPFALPQTPWVASVEPFILKKPGQFQPRQPAPLASQAWVDQFDEIKSYGRMTGSARTPEQTAIARFWTANAIRQYNRLGRDIMSARSLDRLESARLAAMINVVGADAQMSVMNSKYQFLFWRPVTAIDPTAVSADGFGPVPGLDDGNERTVEETGWRPLITTPNHPEYPAAHGSLTSAIAEVLSDFLGTEHIDVTIRGFDAAGAAGNLDAVRHFESANQLRGEIVEARLWAGLHYRGSSEAGVDLGRKVAHYALNHAFRAR
ncbi:MAG TPA: vanadium-dependent haloperoxidase [Vicinamibacterales bacterium]|nr:vanadium-dependent haloperoxidase [Vicinamibacterales bacterium]